MAVQLLSVLCPATVIAVDQRASALRAATDAGATHAVNSGSEAAATIRELTKGRGADLVLDVVGVDATLALGAAVVRQLGHLTMVGIGGGSLAVSFFGVPYEASVATTYWGTIPELMEVVTMAQKGDIRANVQTFPLERAIDAYEAMRTGQLDGRAVIVP